MPQVPSRGPDTTCLKLLGDPTHSGDTRAPYVVHNALKVDGLLCGGFLNRLHGLRVAYLLPPESPGTIGITEFDATRLSSNQRGLGAFTDKANLQLRYSGHLREQEATHGSRWHAGKVAEHQV